MQCQGVVVVTVGRLGQSSGVVAAELFCIVTEIGTFGNFFLIFPSIFFFLKVIISNLNGAANGFIGNCRTRRSAVLPPPAAAAALGVVRIRRKLLPPSVATAAMESLL